MDDRDADLLRALNRAPLDAPHHLLLGAYQAVFAHYPGWDGWHGNGDPAVGPDCWAQVPREFAEACLECKIRDGAYNVAIRGELLQHLAIAAILDRSSNQLIDLNTAPWNVPAATMRAAYVDVFSAWRGWNDFQGDNVYDCWAVVTREFAEACQLYGIDVELREYNVLIEDELPWTR
jgi:hypothetical protein